MSVQIAKSWKNPAEEIAAEFLDQLAEDLATYATS